MWYKERMAPEGVKVYNPAFDVTDHELIAGIVTEYGVARAHREPEGDHGTQRHREADGVDMKRNVSLAEISDGRLYKANDMVKAVAVVAMAVRCCHGMEQFHYPGSL